MEGVVPPGGGPQDVDPDVAALQSHICHQKDPGHDTYAQRAISLLVNKLREKKNHELTSLIRAITTKGAYPSECITLRTISKDGRLKVAEKKNYPHVLYTRIWRWPDVSRLELNSIKGCQFGFQFKRDCVCVNPYHYDRTTKASSRRKGGKQEKKEKKPQNPLPMDQDSTDSTSHERDCQSGPPSAMAPSSFPSFPAMNGTAPSFAGMSPMLGSQNGQPHVTQATINSNKPPGTPNSDTVSQPPKSTPVWHGHNNPMYIPGAAPSLPSNGGSYPSALPLPLPQSGLAHHPSLLGGHAASFGAHVGVPTSQHYPSTNPHSFLESLGMSGQAGHHGLVPGYGRPPHPMMHGDMRDYTQHNLAAAFAPDSLHMPASHTADCGPDQASDGKMNTSLADIFGETSRILMPLDYESGQGHSELEGHAAVPPGAHPGVPQGSHSMGAQQPYKPKGTLATSIRASPGPLPHNSTSPAAYHSLQTHSTPSTRDSTHSTPPAHSLFPSHGAGARHPLGQGFPPPYPGLVARPGPLPQAPIQPLASPAPHLMSLAGPADMAHKPLHNPLAPSYGLPAMHRPHDVHRLMNPHFHDNISAHTRAGMGDPTAMFSASGRI